MSVAKTGTLGGVVDASVDGPARTKFDGLSVPQDALLELLSFLPHQEAHRILALPLSNFYVDSFYKDEKIWKARCVRSWSVPASWSIAGWRALHEDLVRCLSLIGHTLEACEAMDANVALIIEVLDRYRLLSEMARACFGHLGHLLEHDEARQATKKYDAHIMAHALWTLKAYPDDEDIQLKVLGFLVLAGRPIGGSEGMVFRRHPTSDGILKAFGPSGEGVEAVLACMKRYPNNAKIQAMSCWSMVNLALIVEQKALLVWKNAIPAIVRAMACHPQNTEVHFRAMFALINLVTPDLTSESTISTDTMKAVVTIVLSAIQAFSHVNAIVNRGCLVLHNIALDPGHMDALVAMGAPQELVQVIGKHPSDTMLCQCATGTLRRLHMRGLIANGLNGGVGVAQVAPMM